MLRLDGGGIEFSSGLLPTSLLGLVELAPFGPLAEPEAVLMA